MTDAELFQFSDVFKGLERVFPKRLEEHERTRMTSDYFKILRKFPLSAVAAGAEVWMQRGKYFPKPAEWIDAMPKRPPQTGADIPTMSEQDSREYRKAEQMRYESRPCACRECVDAGVTEKPMRFVPNFDQDGREIKARDGERIVTTGHWAHGFELARWYQAKADFYNKYLEVFGGLPQLGAA